MNVRLTHVLMEEHAVMGQEQTCTPVHAQMESLEPTARLMLMSVDPPLV